jgi:hypothetical protein
MDTWGQSYHVESHGTIVVTRNWTVLFHTTLVSLETVPSSALKTNTLCFSETLVSTYESARRYNPEEHHHHHFPDRENLEFPLCVYLQEIIWMNLLREISFVHLVSSVYTGLRCEVWSLFSRARETLVMEPEWSSSSSSSVSSLSDPIHNQFTTDIPTILCLIVSPPSTSLSIKWFIFIYYVL